MMNEHLREELKTMAADDRQLRQELLDHGELGDGYAPRMEGLHRKNAARLKGIIIEHGWPDRELVGDEGTLAAAWFIAQHAIGDPEFQRQALTLIQEKVSQGKVPPVQEAYLFDRIAMYEGRPATIWNAVASVSRWQVPAMADGKSRSSESAAHLNGIATGFR
jgi:hypothetical protein